MPNSITCDVILTYMSDMLFVMTVDADKEFRYAKMNPAAMRASGLNEYAYGATFQMMHYSVQKIWAGNVLPSKSSKIDLRPWVIGHSDTA